jgi:transcriptional regulator with XRE-family HTH domain
VILIAKGKFDRWRTKEGLTLLEGWAREGLTDEEIARKIRINPDTLYEWKKRFSEISEAIKKGKEVIDFEVEQALLKRALGYSYTETRKEIDANGKKKVIVTEKHVEADTAAQIFWLRNRKPDKWRNNPEAPEGEDDKLNAYLEGMKNAKPL